MNWIRLPLALTLAIGGAWAQGELQAPFKVEAAGAAVDTEIGHAAPFVCDWDGDGKQDLLVGQFGEGKLFIYSNVGTPEQPAFDARETFPGTVPTG